MATTWKKQITKALEFNRETWQDVIKNTLTDSELNRVFDDGGSVQGSAFTVWTANYVYFPV